MPRTIPIWRATVVMVLLASFAMADMMYEWVDGNGNIILRATPPPTSAPQKVKHSTLLPSGSPSKTTSGIAKGNVPQTTRPVAKKEPFRGTVEIYVTSWCPQCARALDYLKEKQVPYVAYDIEKDSAAHERYKELKAKGVPLILIGSKRIHGFSPESVDRFLAAPQ